MRLGLDTFVRRALSPDDGDCDAAAVARFQAAAGLAVYAVAVVVAAVVEGTGQSVNRGIAAALLEAVPALLLAAAALRFRDAGTSRAGRLCFVAAMMLLAGAIVAIGDASHEALAFGVGALAAAGVLLAAAYLRSHIGDSGSRAGRRLAASFTVALLIIATLPAGAAISAWVNTSSTSCGVDSCAFAGLAIAFGFGIAGVFILLAVFAAALSADKLAALGVFLSGAG